MAAVEQRSCKIEDAVAYPAFPQCSKGINQVLPGERKGSLFRCRGTVHRAFKRICALRKQIGAVSVMPIPKDGDMFLIGRAVIPSTKANVGYGFIRLCGWYFGNEHFICIVD